MSSDFDIVGWCNIIGYGYVIILGAVMAFRETESKHTPDDNDKAGIIINKSNMDFKRVVDVENNKNEETKSK